jgi:hypothetical protein
MPWWQGTHVTILKNILSINKELSCDLRQTDLPWSPQYTAPVLTNYSTDKPFFRTKRLTHQIKRSPARYRTTVFITMFIKDHWILSRMTSASLYEVQISHKNSVRIYISYGLS